ncbi:cell division protein FtsQ/DivIB [Paenibacillus eucommiae]|uniref:Cell division protein DivIB n=1 Tax=Paenibacillus eucommiae TaxID=1355755 RepID=A0ABS4J0M0_9BACL|nr:FtsQ-type POTRA domain-containing protein [Paenibacillus eucommiae]MBP1992791.1 cell division protein FtsQ [Paenibacillus eucommiae]
MTEEIDKVPPLPAVPKRGRTNKKLLAFLIVFFLTVLVILFFQSSLSRISEIQIQGNQLVTKDMVGQAAAINIGDRYFAISTKSIEDRVNGLNIVESVQVTKHFPGVIHILVKEFSEVAFQITAEGSKQAVLSDGTLIDVPSVDFPIDKPILSGWTDTDPNKLELTKVLGELPVGALSDISEIKPEPSASYPEKIKIYTRSQFEVFTTISYLPEKIDNLPAFIASLNERGITSGIITMLEVDTFVPFESSGEQQAGSKDGGKTP